MTPLVTLPHILLVLVGAFLIGVRAYRSTLPAQKEGNEANEDSRQLFRFASIASFGLFLLALAMIFALYLQMSHVTKAIQ